MVHLIDVHGFSGMDAVRAARRAINAATDAAPAKAIEATPGPKEAPVAKKKRAKQKCRVCSKPSHNAKNCPERTATATITTAAAPLNKNGPPSGSLRSISGAAADSAAARASAQAAVAKLLSEALAEAKAYVGELQRLMESSA